MLSCFMISIFSSFREETVFYPRNEIKKRTRDENTKKFNDRLNEKWPQNENIQINYTQTKKVPTASLCRKNNLDVTDYRVEAFALNVINKNLQEMKKRSEYTGSNNKSNKCVMCNHPLGTVEDQEHMWKCTKTIEMFDEIKELTKENLNKAIKDAREKNNLIQEIPAERLMGICKLTTRDFLNSDFIKYTKI